MANYKLSNTAKEDLIRIHHFGVERFGIRQADKYFNEFFMYFEKIANNPFSFEAVEHIRKGYRRCPRGSDTIYYRLVNDEVEIMSIIGKQDYTTEVLGKNTVGNQLVMKSFLFVRRRSATYF